MIPPARPSSARPALLVSALTVVAGAAIWLAIPRGPRRPPPVEPDAEPVAFVHELSGTIAARRGGGSRTLTRGDTVYAGDRVETGAGESVTLTTRPGGALLVLKPDTSAVVDAAAELRLERGRLEAAVPESLIMRMTTPQTEVITRSTGLALTLTPRGTQVHVHRGEAMVKTTDGKSQRLSPGAQLLIAQRPASRPLHATSN